MSGHSDSTTCPNCEGNMMTYSDYKPFHYESGECHDCGFMYQTIAKQMDLESLNVMRTDKDYNGEKLEPLKKQELFKTQYLNIPKLERKAVTLLYDEEYGGNFLFDVEKNPRLYENMMGYYTDVYKGKPIGDASRRKIN